MNPCADRHEPEPSFARPLAILAGLLIVAAGVRLLPETGRPFPFFELELVRWREMLTLFILTPLVTFELWDLKRRVHLTGRMEWAYLGALALLLISMGIHEPMNALSRKAALLPAELAATVRFWDDEFSHYTFFAGFTALSLLLVIGQLRSPRATPEHRNGFIIVIAAALALAAVIFRNMIREPTLPDIAVGLSILVLTVLLWIRHPVSPRRAPLVFSLVLGYALGFGAALITHWISG
ncbi:MAG: hypothetical protein U1E27_04365 [Kiritimatiellia bacterium]|nr:hypothetical protein [Kiritimatiellia bacterium]